MLMNPHRFGTAPTANLVDGDYSAINPTGTATASMTFATNGTATGADTANTGPASYTWLPSGSSANYEIRMTPTSGASFSGIAANSWVSMSSAIVITLASVNSVSGTALLEIRPAGGGAVIDSCTLALTAEGKFA